MMDFERASKIAKARFVVLWGRLAQLSRALAQFMLDLHTREHGMTEVWVPHLVNGATVSGVGVLRKFEDQLFRTQVDEGERPLYLIPTAEVPLSALHAGEILPEATLPRRYCAFTPSYRREAGAAGQDTRGMIRQHQFDKVEMVKITTPEQSYDELEAMVKNAETVLQRLDLAYRVVALSTGDIGFQSAKTYDLEVWLPGQARYREISSCSNCEGFQARRLDIKYRPAGGGRVERLPHAERLGARRGADAGRRPRDLPGGGRVGDDPTGAASLHGGPRAAHAGHVVKRMARRHAACPQSRGVARSLDAEVRVLPRPRSMRRRR